jgi:lipopolysaccharide/colanic/teichoic acid biosynthesis glycosyltransferase
MYKHFFKRFLDILLSLLALICLSPVFLIVTLLLYIANEGAGAFFLQERPGYKGKIFKVIKFKTMNDKKDENGKLLLDTLRITKVGKIVRATSLDELPQLINVLKGDMSLIGPRPLLVKYLPLYSEEQMKRHNVRPGITGWAQCHGRNTLTWAKKFEYDVWYVNHLSFLTDLKVIYYSLLTILKREGINTADETTKATMEEFNGHN